MYRCSARIQKETQGYNPINMSTRKVMQVNIETVVNKRAIIVSHEKIHIKSRIIGRKKQTMNGSSETKNRLHRASRDPKDPVSWISEHLQTRKMVRAPKGS